MTKEPIPVVPAQHYTCGGVMVDLDGCTDAPGLYAAGEVTQSGLHGANRLASNSLLECLVFGEAAAKHILANWDGLAEAPDVRAWDESRVTDSDEEVVITQTWGEIRRFMWNYVGIVRTTKRLERAKHRIDLLRQEVARLLQALPRHSRPDRAAQPGRGRRPDHPLSALSRHESRGLHYTLDYPKTDAEAEGHGVGALKHRGGFDGRLNSRLPLSAHCCCSCTSSPRSASRRSNTAANGTSARATRRCLRSIRSPAGSRGRRPISSRPSRSRSSPCSAS